MSGRSPEILDDNTADLTRLGAQLRALREAQRLSYDDVANATRVRPHLLQAIEDGSVENLAAPVYTRGFIKTYCEYLMADDLWRKYSHSLPPSDTTTAAGGETREPVIDITQPTPMFRRSSMIWVYVILVIAVFGAAFLLWSQQRTPGEFERGFFLRVQDSERSQNVIVSREALDGGDSFLPLFLPAISADEASNPLPSLRSADISSDFAMPRTPAGLSWMGGDSLDMVIASPVPASQNSPKDELFIEIRGENTRLVVRQGGRNVTMRNLTPGESRRYRVTSETDVSLSVGSAADVTWRGTKYQNVGDGNGPLALTFFPDGSVRVTSGSSSGIGDGGRAAQ
ncbi:MAG: helix-turn-helix domain-containing protein [Synergistaceae bacterium]|jgi:cytoskeletal protein RodZ|nr:helix-turn-helix domain-containing protein [Synergistaceae bacterium]